TPSSGFLISLELRAGRAPNAPRGQGLVRRAAVTKALIHLRDLQVRWKGFRLDISELKVCEGEFVAILGKSGCGKSTLLTFLGLLVSPSTVGAGQLEEYGVGCRLLEFPALRKVVCKDSRRTDVDVIAIRRDYLGFSLQGGE